jgi:hypothetical protein
MPDPRNPDNIPGFDKALRELDQKRAAATVLRTVWIVTYLAPYAGRQIAAVFTEKAQAMAYMEALTEARPGSDPMYAQHPVDRYMTGLTPIGTDT